MSGAHATVGVDSVVARCLLDADFLHAVNSNPEEALAPYELDARARSDLHALDFTKIRHFAGFITKVQHNYLWEQTPYTIAMLKSYGIEIEVFAAYHARHLELRAHRATRPEKIVSFLDFLDAHVSRDDYPGLHDVLLHERIEWEIGSLPMEATIPDAHIAPHPFGELVPHVRGRLRLGRFKLDPLEIVDQLSSGRLDATQLRPQPTARVYWADPAAAQLRILDLDDLTSALIGGVDGRRSVRSIVERVAGGTPVDDVLLRVRPIFEATVDLGMLALLGGGRG